ncbi:MAG: esterase family protein, partial [Acidimicrobiia bacterium]|nr:esterase family protein [Acidimicrobiia bacterium]
MRLGGLIRTAAVGGGLLVGLVAPSVGAAPETGVAGAEVVSDVVVEGRLRELVVSSPALGREAGVRVLLPAGYDDPANAGRTWPVLWLLHGVGDDHRSWTARTDVEGLTADLPMVVAMPEAGRTPDAGWYSDWVAGLAWETFHLRELLPLVEARFHAGGARERRAVIGFSMGGFGALSYAARHPDLWVAAGSISGAVDTVLAGPVQSVLFQVLHPVAGTPDDRVWGPYLTSEVVWRGHNPVDLATNLRPLGALWIRTGNGVPAAGDDPVTIPLEVGVYPMNLVLHDRLARAGIAHDWFDRGYGTHDWPYREADLAAILPGLTAVLADPPPPPAAFDHRFVEDERDVFGWRFTVADRGGPAFTELTAVSASGLTAAGLGTLAATTPPGYEGRWQVTTPAGTTEVEADGDGRLAFSLPLGGAPVAVTLAPVQRAATPAAPTDP